jgi:multidrug resistance efflux pump
MQALARILRWLFRTLLWVLTRPVVLVVSGGRRVATSFRFWALALLVVLIVVVAYYVVADRVTPLTTDAYVQAYVIQVAPEVAGRVERVHVREGERVEAGALLFELDPRPFEHKVAYLEAKRVAVAQQVKRLKTEVAAAQAEQERLRAEADYARAVHEQEKQIFTAESTTQRKYLDAVGKFRAGTAAVKRAAAQVQSAQEALDARVGEEHALLAQVSAELAEARLNRSFARVHATCGGIITDLQLREGSYIHVGQAALTLIDVQQWFIVANFRESSLVRLRRGQPAWVALQGEPGRLLPARVEYIGWGVSSGQGTPSGLLPDVKRQPSWVPPAQRFQVRLELDEPSAVPLRVGMTGSVSVYTGTDGDFNEVTRLLHQVIAWLYYL